MKPTPRTEGEIFQFAMEIPAPVARTDFVKQACGENDAQYERVMALLQIAEEDESFLEVPAGVLPVTVGSIVTESPGDSIDEYKLLQQIGEGGFGVVYMAEQHKPVRRKVALKVIKPGMDTKEVIARFESERQALALMDHPNIAKVFDAGSTGTGRPYFVMELVKGIPLNQFCDENSLTTLERLNLFVAVCRAVQHAHQKGVPKRLEWSPHRHRRTFATVAMEAGVLEEVVGRLLNHTPLSITGRRYVKPSLDSLRPAMANVTDELQRRMGRET